MPGIDRGLVGVRIYRTTGERISTPHVVAGKDAAFGCHFGKDAVPDPRKPGEGGA